MALELFVETLDNVPPELTRNFNLITDLDRKTGEVTTKIHEYVKKYAETTKKSERLAIRKKTDELFAKLNSYADDKIELSLQTYDMIDKNIERLNNLQYETTTPDGGKQQETNPIGFDMPLDSNEPKYCICREVSFGEMIACENKECLIEWFHLQCVNLTSAPSGKWYCGTCLVEARKKARSRSRKSRR